MKQGRQAERGMMLTRTRCDTSLSWKTERLDNVNFLIKSIISQMSKLGFTWESKWNLCACYLLCYDVTTCLKTLHAIYTSLAIGYEFKWSTRVGASRLKRSKRARNAKHSEESPECNAHACCIFRWKLSDWVDQTWVVIDWFVIWSHQICINIADAIISAHH